MKLKFKLKLILKPKLKLKPNLKLKFKLTLKLELTFKLKLILKINVSNTMDSDRRKNLYLLEVMVTNVEIDADVLLENFTFDPEKVRLIDATTKVTFSNHFELDIDCLASVIR
ncbi:unnamed protein product, partial [Nesidiocoris tenuis]